MVVQSSREAKLMSDIFNTVFLVDQAVWNTDDLKQAFGLDVLKQPDMTFFIRVHLNEGPYFVFTPLFFFVRITFMFSRIE